MKKIMWAIEGCDKCPFCQSRDWEDGDYTSTDYSCSQGATFKKTHYAPTKHDGFPANCPLPNEPEYKPMIGEDGIIRVRPNQRQRLAYCKESK
jgi:hypothetical protein